MPTLSSKGTQAVQSILDEATSKPKGLVGTVFAAIDRNGNTLFSGASGKKGVEDDTPMDENSIFWIASLTKAVTGIACLQLIEQGKLSLDTEAASIFPELANLDVINEKGEPVGKAKTPITLKMLLTHTAGFSYSFFSSGIKAWCQKRGFDEFSGKREAFNQPLIYEPGTRFAYGVGIDWAGFIVEKITGMDLEAYFRKNIFDPVGAKDITFRPYEREDVKKRMLPINIKDDEGNVSNFNWPPIHTKSEICSGGGGLFSTAADYLKILNVLINDGVAANGTRVLKPESVKLAFANLLSPELAADMDTPFALDRPSPEWSFASPDGVAKFSPEDKRGWSPLFLVTENALDTGRGPGNGWWAGITGMLHSSDPARGVATVILNQLLPFCDPDIWTTWLACEKAVYDNLP